MDGFSLTWPFRYKVTRLTELPADAEAESPIILEADEMLSLSPQEGHGLVYDCFAP